MQSRGTLLFQNSEPWVKKAGNEDFDVPMGCYDGAEVCELIGTFILNRLKPIISEDNVGLYRDDGLGVFQNISKTEIERKKKALIKVFKVCGLSITIQCNLRTVDFLDVTFDLENNTYKPFRKENNKPIYINKHSNHPPNILKQLPKSIEKRISETSSNQDIFDQSIKTYKDALSASGFKDELNFIPPVTNNSRNKTNRKRKIIWFNPPYSRSVKTNIGKIFLSLLSKHFPSSHGMHKIFNRNTVKISYSCLRNIGSIISTHNRNILSPKQQSFGCNCRNKNECPLDGECQTPKVIYRADVTNSSNSEHKFYFGLADTTFKERYRNHTRDFRHQKYENSTELAKYIWQLKRNNISFSVKWTIITKVYGNPNSLLCKLCLTEKLWIINFINDDNLLNKKSELISKCRHLNKHLLRNVKKK